MATASKSKTHYISGSTMSRESIYRDVQNPWIMYIGTRKDSNPNGPRNVWFVMDEKRNEKTGPFVTLKLAWAWVNQAKPPSGPLTENFPQHRGKAEAENGIAPTEIADIGPEPQTTTQIESPQLSLFSDPEPETTDQIIEFACPHCGKSVIGLLGRK
jgi:hypothetical protein